MKSGEKLIISFAAGVGLGAILGILFAPSKGSETRRRIKEGAEEYYSKVGEIVDDIKGMVLNKKHELEAELEEEFAEEEEI